MREEWLLPLRAHHAGIHPANQLNFEESGALPVPRPPPGFADNHICIERSRGLAMIPNLPKEGRRSQGHPFGLAIGGSMLGAAHNS